MKVSKVLKNLIDSASLHLNMAVAFGTSLQHFPGSLSVLYYYKEISTWIIPNLVFDTSNKSIQLQSVSVLSPVPDRGGY